MNPDLYSALMNYNNAMRAFQPQQAQQQVAPQQIPQQAMPQMMAPQPLAFRAFGRARMRAKAIAFDLDADVGRLREVAVPARMLGCAALRRDDDGVLSVLAEDERRRALVAAVTPSGREDEDRRTVPQVADRTVGLDVLLDMLRPEE